MYVDDYYDLMQFVLSLDVQPACPLVCWSVSLVVVVIVVVSLG